MTYSIVARDPLTGELGVAVQSHAFSVGPTVAWARAGVGAVATQSLILPSYGPEGLRLLGEGATAPDALARLVAADASSAVRQVAIVDAQGAVAVHTGPGCIPAAGHVTGEGFSCQANLMTRDTVWQAMADTFAAERGDLAARLMAALWAAEAEGGDIRGKQSAALLVVKAEDTGSPWPSADVVADLRVDDHPEPLRELERLLVVHRAWSRAEEADRLLEAGEAEAGWAELAEAERIAPDDVELRFWKGVTLAQYGHEQEARDELVRVYREDPRWAQVIRRLPPAVPALADPELLERLAAMPEPD